MHLDNLQTRRVAGVIRKSKKNPAENEPKSHHGQITAVAISPDGKYLASGGQDGLVKVNHFYMKAIYQTKKSRCR